MNKLLLIILALSSSLVHANPSEDNDIYPHIFLGVNSGYQFESEDEVGLNKNLFYGAFAGTQFTKNLSLDLNYEYYMDSEYDISELSTMNAALRYDFYFHEQASFYLRGGVSYWMVDNYQTQYINSRESGTSPLLAAGFNYMLTPNWYVNVAYQFINNIGDEPASKFDSNSISLGIAYHFKGKKTITPVVVEDITVSEPVIVKTYTFDGIEDEVSFDFDSYAYVKSPYYDSMINEVVQVLNQHPNAKAKVIGHTDSVGSANYNLKLSKLRAQSIYNELITLGVNPSQLEVVGMGEAEPIASNETSEGRAKNRRTEISILSFDYQR